MYLSVVYFEMLYPSFSFFFRFKISVFRSCMRIYKYIQCYPGDVSVASLFCRDAP